MSIHTITIDDYRQLTPAHHRLAVRLYSAEIDALIERLATLDHRSPEYAQGSEELLQHMQLRKVHQVSLEEQEPARLASEQYEQNQRHDLAA